MQNVPGVHSVMSATPVARYLTAMWNEGNPKWTGIPRNRYALTQAMSSVPAALGVFNADCTVMLVQVFTDDHEEETVRRVVRMVWVNEFFNERMGSVYEIGAKMPYDLPASASFLRERVLLDSSG